MDIHTGMKLDRKLLGICYTSEDEKESAAVFMVKRTPEFRDK